MSTHAMTQPSLFNLKGYQRIPTVSETAATYGHEVLSDPEILSLLFTRPNTSRAQELITKAGGLHYILFQGTVDLRSLGLTANESARIGAVLELVRRSHHTTSQRPRITSPRSAGDYLINRATGWTEERFGLLALNAKGELLAERIISQGTAMATIISPREVFREALRFGASSALVFHNHPSGDPSPSAEDVALTRRLRAAGESLGVPLADHIVIGAGRWHSFRAAEGWDR